MAERLNRTTAELARLSRSTFDETVATNQELLLVDFWGDWCGPCHALALVLEHLTAASGGRVTLAEVNVDENLELAQRYDIRSTPTVLFFRLGPDQQRRAKGRPAGPLGRASVTLASAGSGSNRSEGPNLCKTDKVLASRLAPVDRIPSSRGWRTCLP